MPYSFRHNEDGTVSLILDSTGGVLGTHPSETAAKAQIQAIEASKHKKE